MGRYGGDEFLVLLPGRDAAAARIIAERLRKAVASSQVHWRGAKLPLTVSIGLAARREEDFVSARLLERADKGCMQPRLKAATEYAWRLYWSQGSDAGSRFP